MRVLRQKAYQTTAWKKLRLIYIKEHPLCEECLKTGKVTPATQVHHLDSPFKGGKINHTLFIDINNLQSICPECHARIHAEEQGHMTTEQTISLLDELLGNDNK